MRPSRRLADLAALLALAGGLVFFGWLVRKVGTDALSLVFRENGLGVLGIALAYGLFQASYTHAWSFTLRPRKLGFGRLFAAYLAGDAVNYAFPLAGEPAKAAFLRPEHPTTQGLFSVSVAKYCEFLAQILFYLVGLTATLYAFPVPPELRRTGLLFVAALLAGAGVLFRLQRRGLYGPFLTLWEKLVRRTMAAETRRRIEELDRMIAAFYTAHPGDFLRCLFFKFVGKLGGVAEAWLVLRLLGLPGGLPEAVAIETLAMVANDLVFFIPGRVGGAEGGRTLVFIFLGYGAERGLAYAVIRRVRELLWVGLGWALLAARRLRGRRVLKAALFDFHGTLDAPGLSSRERLRSLAAEAGLAAEPPAFDEAYRRARERSASRAGGLGLAESSRLLVDALFEELGAPGHPGREAAAGRYLEASRRNLARSRELLSRLKGKLRLAILDDGAGNLGLLCLESGLAEVVDLVVDAAALGRRKPDPELFEYALRRLGIAPEEALYVGGAPDEEAAGARAAGLQQLLLGPTPPDEGPHAATLEEAVALLAARS